MAKLSKPQLLEVVVKAISQDGWNVFYLSQNQEHPFRLQIYRADESYRLRIYIWNLTHGGGRARPQNEYPIQITGVQQFEPEIGGKTLILGWWDEGEVFAGFDFNKHSSPLGASPSIQIRKENLEKAVEKGFSPCSKGNQEIALAFRPDFFVEYVQNLAELHGFGESEQDFEILDQVSENPQAVNDGQIETVSQPRRSIISQVRKKLRTGSFQPRILIAYGYSCAMCGLQLELVEAAHIVPVWHETSTDETSNGLALCVLHHRAYDRSLITLNDEYRILLNEPELNRLRQRDRGGELDRFVKELRAVINLPSVITERPNIGYIRRGNTIRGWST